MALNLNDLNPEVRSHMVREVELDISRHAVFFSPRLTEAGKRAYPELLKSAVMEHDVVWLQNEINKFGNLKTMEMSHRKGVPYQKAVPSNAAQLISEGEFNRFYMRGLCCYAIEKGVSALEVYRAKAVDHPRPESETKIGMRFSPAEMLADLRENRGDDQPFLGIPGGPNSGISLRIP